MGHPTPNAESQHGELGRNDEQTDHNGTQPPLPEPTTTLHLYHRIYPGRKHLFATSSTAPARYFILNNVPHKHASQWKPIFYRGDNPKYRPDSKPAARAWRESMWNKFRLEVGDGVGEVLENERRRKERKSYERKQKVRKFFCMKETPPKNVLEEERAVEALVAPVEMKRAFPGRTLTFEVGGQVYTWKGTRRFLPGAVKGLKGMSQDFKLMNADNVLIATFEKDRWSTFKSSEKCEGTPNKKKTYRGTLRIYPSSHPALHFETPSCGGKDKHRENLNLGGSHAGDLTEEAIAFTCWIAVEAEHRLRYKIFDLLEEVGENVGG